MDANYRNVTRTDTLLSGTTSPHTPSIRVSQVAFIVAKGTHQSGSGALHSEIRSKARNMYKAAEYSEVIQEVQFEQGL